MRILVLRLPLACSEASDTVKILKHFFFQDDYEKLMPLSKLKAMKGLYMHRLFTCYLDSNHCSQKDDDAMASHLLTDNASQLLPDPVSIGMCSLPNSYG